MSCQFEFEAIGTDWLIDIFEDISFEKNHSLFAAIKDRIDSFDKTYSRFRKDSLVTEMSQHAGTYTLPADSKLLFSIYQKFYDLTDGLFTPLVADLLVDAGYDAQYSLKQTKELTTPLKLGDVLLYSACELIMKIPSLLDFGAAGKGYLVDLVSELLEENSIENYTVDAGGDIRNRNKQVSKNVSKEESKSELRIGLEDPEDFSKAVGVVRLSNKSLCGSAGNRRTWQHFHHIINPETLESPRDILAVWVIADNTIIADALSTSLFFVRPEKFEGDFDFEYIIMKSDRSVETSDSFPGELFIA